MSHRLAILGSSGSVGTRVVLLALKKGYTVLAIDIVPPTPDPDRDSNPNFRYVCVDLRDYEKVVGTLEEWRPCDGLIQLAAKPGPGDFVVETHNTNVVISWNVLRAAAALGIKRIAQASSVNVIPMVYSETVRFEYFPIDENHPCIPDEPYGLSKVIAELQADTIVRRYPSIRISSLRLVWSIPSRAYGQKTLSNTNPDLIAKGLWGYVQEDSAAEAFLLAVVGGSDQWKEGHEVFFIASNVILVEEDSKELRERYYGDVPVREGWDVSEQEGFFDCRKAERLLGWVHRDVD